MNSILLLALTASLVSCEQDAVTDVVTVNYTLDEPAVVTVDFQTKSAEGVWTSIGAENFTTLAGDVNRYVKPPADGEPGLWLRWAAANDWPDHAFDASNFRAVLTAWPTNDPPPYMAVDLGRKQATTREHTPIRYYVSSNAVPGGVLDLRYRRSYLLMRKIDCAGKVFRRGRNYIESDGAQDAGRRNSSLAKLTKNFYIGVFQFSSGYFKTAFNVSPLITDSKVPFTDKFLQPAMQNGSISYNYLRGNPASGYSWPTNGDAVDGTSYLGKLRALTDNKVLFDLPLEAQYEFACQGGYGTMLGTGKRYNTDQKNTDVVYETCWLSENKDDGSDPDAPYPKVSENGMRRPHRVGLKVPNGYGLYDMQGNGRCRCRDWWIDDPGTMTSDLVDGVHVDPIGPESNASGNHVGRGASWDVSVSSSDWMTCGRFPQSDNGDYNYTTFRVVCPAIAPEL